MRRQPQLTAFSDRLRERILATGRTQKVIATASGIEPATLCRFMRSSGGLSLATIENVLDYLALVELAAAERETELQTKD